MAINIGGRLHSVATGNVVAGANEIYDDDEQKKQSQINAELIAGQTTQTTRIDDININLATKQDKITAVVNPAVTEDGVVPSASVTFENGQLGFSFSNLKGDKGDKGDTGPKGPQGDSAVWDETTGNIVQMAHVLGQDSLKAMSQKGVTDAVAYLCVTDWGASQSADNHIVDMVIDNTGAAADANGDYYRVFYKHVSAGDWVKINGARSSASSSPAVDMAVAVFDDIPSKGDQGVLLDYMANTASFEKVFQMTQDGYLCVYAYGASASISFSFGITNNDVVAGMSERIDGILNETTTNTSTPTLTTAYSSYYIVKTTGAKSSNSNYNITNPIDVYVGDVVTARCNGGSGGTNAIIAKYNEGANYTPLVISDSSGVVKDWTHVVTENCKLAFSYVKKNGGTIAVTIQRQPVLLRDITKAKSDIETLQANVVEYRSSDHMPKPTSNPLARMISGASRARVFKSYGIIGASWETGYTDGVPNDFYDSGRDWPTMFGQVNNVEMHNYSLAGHALANWILHRDDTTFDSEDASIKPECFIINMSSNEMNSNKYTGNPGDPEEIDTEHDYTQDTVTTSTVFTEILANIIQRCRKKSPDCYIYLSTVHKYTPSGGSSVVERMEALCDAMRGMAALFAHCYVLDIHEYGADWSSNAIASIYRSSTVAGAHPSRLGHVYLCDQFNTYIDWHIATYPQQYLDAAYINKTETRT